MNNLNLKQIKEMPSIVKGFPQINSTLNFTASEKKAIRRKRIEKQNQKRDAFNVLTETLPISNDQKSVDRGDEQGGESPLSEHANVDNVSLEQITRVIRCLVLEIKNSYNRRRVR